MEKKRFDCKRHHLATCAAVTQQGVSVGAKRSERKFDGEREICIILLSPHKTVNLQSDRKGQVSSGKVTPATAVMK